MQFFIQLPFPSLLILSFRSVSTSAQSPLVTCDPSSVLCISGGPYFAKVSFNASTQSTASTLLESCQTRTLRLNQSMIVTRYRTPRRIKIYVISAHQTWFGRLITTFFCRYGQILCCGGEASAKKSHSTINCPIFECSFLCLSGADIRLGISPTLLDG